jgi:hypothetical protein
MPSLSSIWRQALGVCVLWIPAGLCSATLTKAVLKLGADPNADEGLSLYTAITGSEIASTKRGVRTVQALLDAGTDVHKARPNPLWWAKQTDKPNPEIIAILEKAFENQPQSPSPGPNIPRQG